MENGNAYEYVQNTLVDPRPLLSDIAEGLHYLHSHKPPIYHGDLKGQNVLISDDTRALLADFGLSFLVDSSFSGCGDANGGTWNWLAPEGFEDVGNDSATPERDVWAFGMTTLVYYEVNG
ncbi:hypothetical protein ID866_9399 [Astraeus odoratus]|nr:hypothetical protein ID866_9399 [Astraeus odoratus]